MESNDLLSLITALDDDIDDLEEALFPFLRHALSDTARTLPLLDQAQLFVLVTYAIESSIFCMLPPHRLSMYVLRYNFSFSTFKYRQCERTSSLSRVGKSETVLRED